MKTNKIFCVDVETGGLDETACALLGVGAVELVWGQDGLAIGRQFELLVHPHSGLRIEPQAVEVNGYNTLDWEMAVPEAQASTGFANFLRLCGVGESDKWMVAGMNVQFDARFLLAWRVRTGKVFPKPMHRLLDLHSTVVFDAFRMAREWSKEALPQDVMNMHSDAVSEYCEVAAEAKPHRPLNGALQAAKCFCSLVNGA